MAKKKAEGRGPTGARLETVRLADLVPHPKQAKYFPDRDDTGYAALKADIQAHGVREPIQVLPLAKRRGKFLIVAGHTRCRVLKELGHETVAARVRYDLRDATPGDVERLLITDNTVRRQMATLDVARAEIRLYEIEYKKKYGYVPSDPLRNEKLRARIGRIVGMSGRNLNRYFNVLESPPEILAACLKGRIRLVDASRVVTLPPDRQKEFAARLAGGECPKVLVASFFRPRPPRRVKAAAAVAALVRHLAAAHATLDGRVEAMLARPDEGYVNALRQGDALIKKLLAKYGPTEE